jgi:hypothetical protein
LRAPPIRSGTKAEARFASISDKAEFASEDLLDVRGSGDRLRSGIPVLNPLPKKPV